MSAAIAERVIALISKQSLIYESAEIQPHHSLAGDLDMDPLDQVELTMAIEDEFAIDVPDSELEGLTTVGQVIEFVTKKAGP